MTDRTIYPDDWPTDEQIDKAIDSMARLILAREAFDRQCAEAIKAKEWFGVDEEAK